MTLRRRVLRLFRGLAPARAEAVAARALAIGALTYNSVASILKNNLDRAPQAAESSTVIERSTQRLAPAARPCLTPDACGSDCSKANTG
jgi:hypothetical protein